MQNAYRETDASGVVVWDTGGLIDVCSRTYSWFLWPDSCDQCCFPSSLVLVAVWRASPPLSQAFILFEAVLPAAKWTSAQLTSKNKRPLPCTNVCEQSTVVMLESQEKMSWYHYCYFHDQWCSLGCVVLLAVQCKHYTGKGSDGPVSEHNGY